MERKGKPATRAKNKYNAKAYDRLSIVVPKGQKAAIEAFAASKGETINGMTGRLYKAEMGLTDDEWKNPAENAK